MSNAYSRLFPRGAVSAPPRWLSVLVLLLLSRQVTLAQSTTLAYTGAPQTYTVPAGVTRLQVTAKGAGHAFAPSGRGALVTATLTVTPGEVLTLVVGGPGGIGGPGSTAGTGGYNGGGPGGTSYLTTASPGEGGSGATDLRRIPGATSASPLAGGTLLGTLNRRLLTAGGAGGKGTDAGANGPRMQNESGWAGTTSTGGAAGVPSALSTGAAGGYGTAGALGVGGTGGNGNSTSGGDGGSGGGGGYYGGGGGAGGLSNTGFFGGTGGGGSSYVEPTALASGTAAPTYSLGTSGNGSVVLTPLFAAPTIRAFIPVVGPVGTSVVLNGSNLSGATAVSFNGTAASGYTVNAAGTELTVTVPAGATTGVISVTTLGGTASSTTSFAVMATGPTTTFAFTGTFPSFTGSPQTYTVPAGVTQLQVIAEGVNVGTVPKGALVTARIQVTPGEVLTVVAGGPGLVAAGNGDPGAGGYNGGGMGGRATGVSSFTPGGEGGGGATDLRRIPGATSGNPLAGGTLTSTLAKRLVVAGGAAAGSDAGTSPGASQDGRAGTTSSGGAGGVSFQGSSFNGYAGSLGEGGAGGTGSSAGGPGGGGGYYGGGGGAVNGAQYGAGGGGSSYVEPTALVSGTTAVYTLRSASFGTTSSGYGVLRLTPVYQSPTLTSFNPGSGATNSTVILTGTNLSGATAVTFNGTAASGYTVNPAGTQLTVQVPGSATSGVISVTTPGGTATSATSFTVTGQGPLISSFSPTYVKSGDAITITGQNLQGLTQLTFNGAPQTAFTVNAAGTEITTTVPARFNTVGSTEQPLTTGYVRATTSAGTAVSPSKLRIFNVIGYYSQATGYNTPPTQAQSGTYTINSGDQIYIKGSGFLGATAGSFEGSPVGSCGTVSSLAASPVVLNDSMMYMVFQPALAGYRSPSTTALVTTSLGSLAPTMGSSTNPFFFNLAIATPFASCLTPTSGAAGTRVTVSGFNFFTFNNGTPQHVATGLAFNGVAGLSFTSNASGFPQTVSAVIPAGMTVSPGPITVRVIGAGPGAGFANGNVSLSFTLETAPSIASFTPGSGPVGTAVTINGIGFSGATAVAFNGTAATFTVNGAGTQITTSVPAGATSGLISVTTPIGTGSSSSAFSVTAPAPTITNFTPARGPVNMRVDISGTNFTGVSSVTFTGNGGPVAANISTSSAGLISVNVPAGAISGPIRVTTPGGTAVSSTSFIVQPDPVVYSFSPTSGPAGTQVVITGANFTGAQVVSFNTAFLFGSGFVVNSDNQLTATVPASATTGPIGVNTGGSTGFSATNFTVTAAAPTISSFTPTSGAAGTSVTITGTGFTGATAVRFNGTSATYSVVSATQITTSVPAGAASGPISVTTAGGTATSSTAFTVPAPNAAPTALALSNASVAENQPYNTLVGSFFTTDPNPSDTTHTYTLVTGVGSGGNGNFVISGRQLRTNTTFDFETQASYSIRVRTTDAGGLWFERTFTISVSNLADLPTISSFTPTSGPAGTTVTVTGTNLFNLTGVSINNVAVTSPIISDPIAGDQATFNVPAGATTGLIRISTTAGTGTSATNFTVPAPTPSDLTVSSAQNISGSYNNVTITGTGAATLTGPLKVTGTLTVQAGGALLTNCQPVRGAGAFVLAAGASLSICDAAGIRASSSDTTGAIRLTGTRSFSPDATYRYNGTQFQFTGSGLPAQVRSLEVNNASGLWISQPVAVAQVLTLTNGNLNTNNQVLTLLSSASGTALVVNAGSGTVNGTTTVQRYISPAINAGLGYRHLAPPVTFAPVSDLATASFAPVVNPAYNTSATPNLVTPFPTVFSYDQSRLASSPATSYTLFDRGWVSPSSLSSQLDPGKGYTVNMAGGQTVDFIGGLLSGNSFFGFSRGTEADAGWQLLGNPYPAPLDWSRVTAADRPGLNAAVYVYESTGPYVGRYRSYANGIGDTPIIPLGQAFFVRVADGQSSAALTLRNSHRLTTPDATPVLRGTADTRPQMELQLQGAGTADAAYVYFEQGATTGVDAEYDARKLPNTTGLNLAALAGTDALAVSGLPQLTGATVVPLQVLVPAAGTYTLAAAQLRNLAPGTQVLLHDAQTGQDTDLQQQPRYSFSTGTNPAGRFSLVFRTGAVTATANAPLAAQLSVFPNPTQGKFELRLAASALTGRAEVVLYNSLGQPVQRQTLPVTANGLQATVDAAHLPTGVYTLRLTLANGSQLTKRVVKQ